MWCRSVWKCAVLNPRDYCSPSSFYMQYYILYEPRVVYTFCRTHIQTWLYRNAEWQLNRSCGCPCPVVLTIIWKNSRGVRVNLSSVFPSALGISTSYNHNQWLGRRRRVIAFLVTRMYVYMLNAYIIQVLLLSDNSIYFH